jgi:xanthine dehydrogenase molybdenum-binding subunit
MSEPFEPRVPRRHVGHYRPRLDGLAKASGSAEYLDDIALEIRFPGMLYAKVLRSPYPHARIKRLDVSKAEKHPGVHAILTYDDPEVASLKRTSNAWTSIITTPYDRYTMPKYMDRRVLDDHVRWVGDEAGVVVAAESEAIAEEALRLLDIEWEVLPFALNPEEAMRPEAAVIHPEINAAGNVLPAEPRGPGDWEPIEFDEETVTRDVYCERGDVDQGFADAHVTIEVSTDYHNADHGCLDSMGCLIYWERDKLVCWTNSYQADQTRMMISEMLNMPLNKVRVICPYLGASMGRWNVGDQVFFVFTALLAKRTGRPIKFKFTRREDFHDTRQQLSWRCKMGARSDGTITAADFYGLADSGAYAEHTVGILKSVPLEIVTRCLAHIPNVRMEGYAVYTNRIPGGMMRCTGNIQFNLALGLAVDALAEKLGMDPIEVAVKNFGHTWGPVPNKDLESVLREGARRLGWGRRHKPGEGPVHEGCKRRGMGFSFHMGWHAEWEEKSRGHGQVGIKVNPDLSVILEAATVETGGGSNTCNVLTCAESLGFLGVRPEDVNWVSTVDTETGYKDCVQTDSVVSYLQGELMSEAAQQIKAKILELAAPDFELPPGELDVEDGRVYVKADPDRGMGVRDLLWKGDMVPILATVSRRPDETPTGVPYVANFAEVEVDTETGLVEVLKLVVVNDCGTVIFATGAEAQQIGGQCIGLGETFTEEIVYDEATGVPLNFNWVDYKILTIADFPEVEPALLEVWRGAGEYGACGIGESVFCCTPTAISNAIHNALGVRIKNIPFTPDKILKALESSGDESSRKEGSL